MTTPRDNFETPTIQHRVAVMGSTGSGKTQFGVWLLSLAPFDQQPYIIFDYKREHLFAQTDRIKEIGVGELPKQPGVYIVRMMPAQHVEVNDYLLKIWDHENVGLFFDEAYMLPDKDGLSAVLTQGRSKNIPAIILTQRPAWISRFVFSEANHYAVFRLNDLDDRKTVRRFLPPSTDLTTDLPNYHSLWYTVGKREAVPLLPVPGEADLLERLESRLAPKERRRLI